MKQRRLFIHPHTQGCICEKLTREFKVWTVHRIQYNVYGNTESSSLRPAQHPGTLCRRNFDSNQHPDLTPGAFKRQLKTVLFTLMWRTLDLFTTRACDVFALTARVEMIVYLLTYNVKGSSRQFTLPAARQHPSYGNCLEVKRAYYQNCSVLDCVTQCSQSAAHLYEQFLQVQQIGFVTLGPLRHV